MYRLEVNNDEKLTIDTTSSYEKIRENYEAGSHGIPAELTIVY